ncbi:hypothetical protein [Bradyrhizobium roseum]|uniref:hypothetical protein n=1 Tax=Bradyrhizobium roseum TaxID=3056648 RepID=UPI0026298FC6|nr:hypothetical protein [Bradyrhizobium roseus]WKA26472.1 hypothetical protein QUH67_23090 [Bradyrhizobium roseus]
MANLIITGMHHDITRKRSIVTVRWDGDDEKTLGLVVPFGCSMDNAIEEAMKAVRALSEELSLISVKLPDYDV